GAASHVSTQVGLGGWNVPTLVSQTGRAARIDDFAGASGLVGDAVREIGVRAAVGVPIRVEGGLWGVRMAASRADPLAGGTQARLAGFTELAGTAIANAQARVDWAGQGRKETQMRFGMRSFFNEQLGTGQRHTA